MGLKLCLIIFSLLQYYIVTACNFNCSSLFAPNPENCSTFFQCDNGHLVLRHCPVGLEWNPVKNTCDWSTDAGCVILRSKDPLTNALISSSEFDCSVKTKGGQSNVTLYQSFIASLPMAGVQDKSESAKLLAHEIWETGGFQFTHQLVCIENMSACVVAFPNDHGGKEGQVYYGRGMLQLTWDFNYAAASEALYHDDRLIQNPDLVADDPTVAHATAAWFWLTYIHGHASTFGETLKALNGDMECQGGPNVQIGAIRFEHYKEVLKCLNMTFPAETDGYCDSHSKKFKKIT